MVTHAQKNIADEAIDKIQKSTHFYQQKRHSERWWMFTCLYFLEYFWSVVKKPSINRLYFGNKIAWVYNMILFSVSS